MGDHACLTSCNVGHPDTSGSGPTRFKSEVGDETSMRAPEKVRGERLVCPRPPERRYSGRASVKAGPKSSELEAAVNNTSSSPKETVSS